APRRRAAATLRGRLRFLVRAVAQLDGVPALRCGSLGRFLDGFFRVGGRLDAVRARPLPALLRREAAAVPPTLLGGLAAARMILAWERLAGVLVDGGGQRNVERGEQIGHTNAGNAQPVSEGSPGPGAREGTHGRKLCSSVDAAPTSYDPAASPSSPRLFSLRRPPFGRCGESCRIDTRQGDAGRIADPGVAVALRRLERGDCILGLFAKISKPDRGAQADV